MFEGNRVSVLIPAYNEEESIAQVLREIPRDIADEIIVVDNGSADHTEDLAAASGARVIKEKVRGYGAACLKGLSSIEDTDIVVILDADRSDYPEQIGRLLKPISDGEAEFVLGSRMLGRRQKGALALQALWGNRLAVFLIRLLFGFSYTDMGPFRAIKFACLKKINLRDKNFGWNAEMQIKAVKFGLRIKEVPVDYRRRLGISKISGSPRGTILAGAKIIFTVFKYLIVKTNPGG